MLILSQAGVMLAITVAGGVCVMGAWRLVVFIVERMMGVD